MKKLVIALLLLMSLTTLGQQRQVYLDHDVSKTVSSKPKEKQSTTVYVCNGSYAVKYHSRNNCRGLSNCRGGVHSVSKAKEKEMGRNACSICH